MEERVDDAAAGRAPLPHGVLHDGDTEALPAPSPIASTRPTNPMHAATMSRRPTSITHESISGRAGPTGPGVHCGTVPP